MKRYLTILCLLALTLSCSKEVPLPQGNTNDILAQEIDQLILDKIVDEGRLFDWSEQDASFICKAMPLTGNVLIVGIHSAESDREDLQIYLSRHSDELTVQDANERLGIYRIQSEQCHHIDALRQLNGVEYLELDYFPSDLSSLFDPSVRLPQEEFVNYRSGTPGNYIPGSMPYLDYLQPIDGGGARRARLHEMDRVYHELGYYGSAETGVAIIDNGVHLDKVPYFQTSPGGYAYSGYFTNNWFNEDAPSDGPHPRPSDVQGLWQLIEPSFNHGTGMTDNIFGLAPFSYLHTMRASPTYIILFPSQFTAITKAVEAAADDDHVKVISMSMASPFNSNQVKSAIRYFNSKNKIMVSAAGSSLPILKDILKVLFPARIAETVSVTGLKPTEANNGNFILGYYAHGGPQNDFVTDDASSSSTGTSTFAGMLAVLWSINPDLDREILIDILKRNSNFYQSLGHKHGKFGWGKVNMYEAALEVVETL